MKADTDQAAASRRPHLTLTVATSADGFIARTPEEPPQVWASPEEQVLFFNDVEAADWAIMGRHTHLAADREDRRRIVFSTSVSGWQRPTQLWLDPAALVPSDLPALVSHRAPFERGIILGGTRVHDWFFRHGAIDRVHLTIEPVRFGTGLPVFSGAEGADPLAAIGETGLDLVSDTVLNDSGTRYLVWERAAA